MCRHRMPPTKLVVLMSRPPPLEVTLASNWPEWREAERAAADFERMESRIVQTQAAGVAATERAESAESGRADRRTAGAHRVRQEID